MYRVIAIIGLVLYALGMRYQWDGAAWPKSIEAKGLKYPARVDGRSVESAMELEVLAERGRPGDVLVVEQAAGPVSVTLERDLSLATFVITCISSLLFWAVAAFVFAPRLQHPGARPFYWLLFLGGMSLAFGGGYPPGVGDVLTAADMFCLAFLPALFVHLALSFPRAAERTSLIARGLFAVAFAVGATRSALWLRYVHDPAGGGWSATVAADSVASALLVTQATAGLFLLVRGARRAVLDQERKQAWWLLWGIGIGAVPFVFLRKLPQALNIHAPIDLWVDRVFELAIPVSFALAVVRYRFLNIDLIVRRSAIYTILAMLLVGVYLLAVLWAGPPVPTWPEAVRIVAVALAVAIFQPTRRAVGAFVDRSLFHMRRDHARALAALHVAVNASPTQRDLAGILERFLADAFDPTTAVAVVQAGGEIVAGGASGTEVAERAAPLFDSFGPLRSGPVARPNATGRPEVESERFPRELEESGAVLLQPAVADGRCMAILCLGEKRTGRRYVEEELGLLAKAAAAAAEALVRMDLVQRMAAEETARRGLAELNRLKTEFLFRVAHDLRTPLTSIDWSTKNLLDGIAGPLAPKQVEYLESVEAACRGLARRVSDLVEISRMEVGGARATLAAVDLAAVAAESVASLKPLAASKSVRIEMHAESGVPPVRGDRDKLFAVLQNLIDNAIKYSPPGSTVEIRIGRVDGAGGGGVRLTVRDHGPGLDEAEKAGLFDRHRQGRPSPYSGQQGFGLGLHIVKSYVELCGGRVSAENHPDGGARFVVLLHEWKASEGPRA